MRDTQYIPPQNIWNRVAPVRNDTYYRHTILQGQVDDENCYANGGIAGHAGLYSTAEDVYKFMNKWMFPGPNDPLLNTTTVSLWVKEYNHSQSSRAIGWNTNDPNIFDQGWNQSCGDKFSPKAFTHTGFTGTQVCGDFERGIFTVLLTNRVFPDPNNNQIRLVRKYFGDAVIDALNSQDQKNNNNKYQKTRVEK